MRMVVINLCEIKCAQDVFVISKGYADELQQKITAFRLAAQTKKSIFITLITTFGVYDNTYKTSMVQSTVVMKDLFAP